jgi:DNA ligase (NAD+)
MAPGEAVRHDPPMLSLDKCYDEAELSRWAEKVEGMVMATPKMDGVAAAIRYDERGRLTLAATRGSGVVGENITANIKEIRDVPKTLAREATGGASSGPVEVRGEIYMRLSVFATFKERFSNPRNLTAGAIKQKEAGKSAAYNLSFAAYDVLGSGAATEEAKFAFLEAAGFPPVERVLCAKEKLQAAYESFAARRGEFDFEIDGVVFKANDVAVQGELGATAHHPRHAIAYKFQGDSATTTLCDIEWSVSRTGAITPVALIEPVELSGAMVARASLHNAGFIDKLGLRRGAKVMVTRRGGVIPNVEFVVEPGEEPFEAPTACPSCGAPTARRDDFLFCSAPEQCKEAMVGQISHFVAVCEIEGFGAKSLLDAYDKAILRSPIDLFRVTREQLMSLDLTKDRKADNLLGQIDAHRELPLAVFLRALGLPELGRNVSEILVREFRALERIRAVTAGELAAIHSIGEVIAEKVVAGLRDAAPLIDELLKHVTVIESEEGADAGEAEAGARPLSGRSFVFTGGLEAMARAEAQKRVAALGAATPSGVTKDLTYLVCGPEKSGKKSSKQVKAEKLIAAGESLKILDETGFLKLLEEAEAGQ